MHNLEEEIQEKEERRNISFYTENNEYTENIYGLSILFILKVI